MKVLGIKIASIVELVRNQSPFNVLPTWPEIAILFGVGLAVLSGAVSFIGEMNIHGAVPDPADLTTGQTFRVAVDHGSARYVMQHEKENLDFWESNVGLFAGAPMIIAFFL